ncbi:MAG: nucleotidyltransferase domain-containing protein [Verrucomicrobiae bacterium]|nr:nucleotidyltransferase domain-containing protein [Verrucomicrobiae bacterium]MDW7979745.1 nucleotidyltransferase domain-containing protein [Verrucomicrobiales bacterium]
MQRPPVDEALIHEIVRRIVEAFNPRRIIPFGSGARGDKRSKSDIDLFIETESDLHPVIRRTYVRKLFWPPPKRRGLLCVSTPSRLQKSISKRSL